MINRDNLTSAVIYAVYFAVPALLVTGIWALQTGATP